MSRIHKGVPWHLEYVDDFMGFGYYVVVAPSLSVSKFVESLDSVERILDDLLCKQARTLSREVRWIKFKSNLTVSVEVLPHTNILRINNRYNILFPDVEHLVGHWLSINSGSVVRLLKDLNLYSLKR